MNVLIQRLQLQVIMNPALESSAKIEQITAAFESHALIQRDPNTGRYVYDDASSDPELAVQVGGRCGWTLLGAAAKVNDCMVAQWLLAQGADVSVGNDFGQSPLLIAAEEGHVEMMDLLLSAAADVNLKTSLSSGSSALGGTPRGHNALHRAIRFGQAASVRWLLTHGAIVEICHIEYSYRVKKGLLDVQNSLDSDESRIFGIAQYRDVTRIPSLECINSILNVFFPPSAAFEQCMTSPQLVVESPYTRERANKYVFILSQTYQLLRHAAVKNTGTVNFDMISHIIGYLYGESRTPSVREKKLAILNDCANTPLSASAHEMREGYRGVFFNHRFTVDGVVANTSTLSSTIV